MAEICDPHEPEAHPRNGVPIGRVVGNWPNCYAWQTDVSLSNQQSCALRFQPVRGCSWFCTPA